MVALQKFQEHGTSTIHRLRGLRMHAGGRRVCGRTRTSSTERTTWDTTSIAPPTRLCAVENNDWKRGLKFRFIDSLKFLAVGLEKLASDLSKERLPILRREF